MKSFQTLLLREWLQNRRGWIVMLALPIAALLLAAVFGQIQGRIDDTTDARPPSALALSAGTIWAVAMLMTGIAWCIAALQTPGLARRDERDRSIEFWLSLPTGHAPSLAAPLLAHLLLMPLAALAAGLAGGLAVSLVACARLFGIGAWLALPWGAMAAAGMALGLHIALGIVLATLWLSPIILALMAAAAWFGGWGVPALVSATSIGGFVLAKGYGQPIVYELLARLTSQAWWAFAGSPDWMHEAGFGSAGGFATVLADFPAHALADSGEALSALASPAFVGALAAAAACFGLLWWRRSRSG